MTGERQGIQKTAHLTVTKPSTKLTTMFLQPGSNRTQSSKETTSLYRVTLRVRPSKDHPRFWEVQYGYLHICLYSTDQNEAAGRAVIIAEQLPYELVFPEGTKRVIVRRAGGSTLPELVAAEERAKDIGVSFFWNNYATGVDEGDFETMLPP
jgi:hypothetical protein